MTVSLDQTFPGWHELCICYQNQGWKLEEGGRVWHDKEDAEMLDGSGRHWSYITGRFSNNEGEKGFLVFSLFDAFGDPYEAPQNWETIDYLLSRTRNRLQHRVRASLFRGETFQTQAFVQSAQAQKIDEDQEKEIISRYLKLREEMRVHFLKRRSGELKPSPKEAEPSSDDSTVAPTP